MPSDTFLEDLLTKMYKEPRTSVVDRERTLFDQLTGSLGNSLILFGAGSLGRQTVKGLRKKGVVPMFFTDNRDSLWGTHVDGIEVLPPKEASARYGDTACFVVTVYNGSRPRRQLLELGCRSVTSYAPLFWKYSDVFIPSTCMGLAHTMWDHMDAIRLAYSVLADDHSRQLFREQLQWRANLDSAAMSGPSPIEEIYFPNDIVTPSISEVLVDCGAFDGDSIRSFLALRDGQFEHVFALKPDPANRDLLESFRRRLSEASAARFTILPYAVGKHRSPVNFAGGDQVRSHVSYQRRGSVTRPR